MILLVIELEDRDLNKDQIKDRAVEVARMAEILFESKVEKVRAGKA